MKKHYFRIILAAVLFVGMVAVGVHILHRNAQAQTAFNVYCYDLDSDPVDGLRLHIFVYEGEEVLLNEDMGNPGGGIYVSTPIDDPGEFAKWRVTLVAGADPVVPIQNPVEHLVSETTYFDWQVDPD